MFFTSCCWFFSLTWPLLSQSVGSLCFRTDGTLGLLMHSLVFHALMQTQTRSTGKGKDTVRVLYWCMAPLNYQKWIWPFSLAFRFWLISLFHHDSFIAMASSSISLYNYYYSHWAAAFISKFIAFLQHFTELARHIQYGCTLVIDNLAAGNTSLTYLSFRNIAGTSYITSMAHQFAAQYHLLQQRWVAPQSSQPSDKWIHLPVPVFDGAHSVKAPHWSIRVL